MLAEGTAAGGQHRVVCVSMHTSLHTDTRINTPSFRAESSKHPGYRYHCPAARFRCRVRQGEREKWICGDRDGCRDDGNA
ncbi:unnamed protein product [Ectocarpus sp. 6 AP-2014]